MNIFSFHNFTVVRDGTKPSYTPHLLAKIEGCRIHRSTVRGHGFSYVGVENNQTPRQRNTRRRVKPLYGFTLIELLVVVAIISLLVSILLPSLTKAKELALKVVCVSNLKNVGLGCFTYASDYDGSLPGPSVSTWAQPFHYYDLAWKRHLVWYLAPYVGHDSHIDGEVVEALLCPAYARLIDYQQDPLNLWPHSYATNFWFLPDGTRIIPFGRKDPFLAPLRLDQAGRPSESYVLRDHDKQIMPSYSLHPLLPEAPIHGMVRNFLYLDGHVAEVQADWENPDNIFNEVY